jgi:hypothetical protein
MTAQIADRVADFGLNALVTEASDYYIVGAATEPIDYAAATGPAVLAHVSLTRGTMFNAPTTIDGQRLVMSVALNGTCSADGTAGWWAITDNTAGRLLCHGALATQDHVAVAGVTKIDGAIVSIGMRGH